MTQADRLSSTSDHPVGRSGKGRGPRRLSRSRRRGTAIVEFAIVAPLFFLVILGIIEFGRMVMVQQILTNASREGARRAILEGATAPDVETIVTDYLTNTSVSGATVTVAPGSLSGIGFGDPVSVTVSVPFDRVSWVPGPWFLGGKTLSAQSVMRAERAE
jgi:Flp pilus assembly protein TadG